MKREAFIPPFWLLFAILLLVVLQVFIYYPQLPTIVASHFARDGQPNGWSSKQGFFRLYFIVFGIVVATFFLLPRVLRRLPIALINIPNKQYWLAEERREHTLLFLQHGMNWFGIVTACFLLAVIQLVIHANLYSAEHLASSTLVFLMGAYYLYLAGWILSFWRRFRRVT